MTRPFVEPGTPAATPGAPGSQTLARGLSALQLVANSPAGLTVTQVADDIGVHRTIAYRLLSTLAQFRFIAKGEDGRYRSAAALAVLGASFDATSASCVCRPCVVSPTNSAPPCHCWWPRAISRSRLR